MAVAGLGLLHVMPFEERRAQIEKAATGQLQQPVSIQAMHFSILPRPHWRLEGVVIGNEGQVKVAQVKAMVVPGSLFGEVNALDELEIEDVVLNEQGLGWLLFGKPLQQSLKLARVDARNVRLESKNIALPVLAATMEVAQDGGWQNIQLKSAEPRLAVKLQPKGGAVQVDFSAASYAVPFGSAAVIEDIQATGVASRGELEVTEFSGRLHGGSLSGNARVTWEAAWSLEGEWTARQVEAAQLAPGLMEEGRLDGKVRYSSRAGEPDKLFASPRIDGNFIVRKGTLLGVDFAALLQNSGGSSGGKTSFSELTGNIAADNRQTQLRQLRLAAGAITATGNARVAADDALQGRIAVELKASGRQRNASLVVSGTRKEPRLVRQ